MRISAAFVKRSFNSLVPSFTPHVISGNIFAYFKVNINEKAVSTSTFPSLQIFDQENLPMGIECLQRSNQARYSKYINTNGFVDI
jgi:hypothetical protein